MYLLSQNGSDDLFVLVRGRGCRELVSKCEGRIDPRHIEGVDLLYQTCNAPGMAFRTGNEPIRSCNEHSLALTLRHTMPSASVVVTPAGSNCRMCDVGAEVNELVEEIKGDIRFFGDQRVQYRNALVQIRSRLGEP